jgi:3-methyladenine DNA glycosylase/8-oxoguanine DNA glycosylase
MGGAALTVRLERPLDLRRTVGAQQAGHGDPTTQVTDREAWRATRTPDGPGTLHVRHTGDTVVARAWGTGAAWLLERAPALLGEHDPPFASDHPVVGPLARRFAGVRIGRSDGVWHALVPVVLAQRVTAGEALSQWHRLCRTLGEPAPGPCTLVLPPAPEAVAEQPYWWFHRFGIERKRADTLRRAAAAAHRLEAAATMSAADAERRLRSVPGLGAWTVAEVAAAAFGDPDAVPVGDFHVPHTVAWALAGEVRGTDDRMLELLAPFAGQRGRVIRLLGLAGIHAPARGPRRAVAPIASW